MKEKSRNLLSAIIILVFMTPIVYFTIVELISRGVFSNNPIGSLWLNILAMVIGIFVFGFVNVVFHELGHLTFGLLNNFKFYSMHVGPFYFYKENKDLKVTFIKSHHYGSCVMLPKGIEKFYQHTVLMMAGGCIFTFILSIASGVLIFLCPDIPSRFYSFLGLSFVVNSFMFFRELLPYSKNMVANDGYQMWGLATQTKDSKAYMNLFSIQAQIMQGIRPSNIPETMFFDVPKMNDDEKERLIIEDYRYIYYLDKQDIENALKCSKFMEENMSDLEDAYYLAITVDLFFNYAHYIHDYEKAKMLYDEIKEYNQALNCVTNYRVQMAYYLYIENDLEKACYCRDKAMSVKNGFIMRGLIPLESRLIQEMNFEIENRQKVKNIS